MGKSSKDKRDIYYRLAKEHGYRARSAYKLLQLDAHYNFLAGARRVIDLCAAPGSWSQVVSGHFHRALPPAIPVHQDDQDERGDRDDGDDEDEEDGGRILVAVDLQPMAALAHTITLQADITSPDCHDLILSHFTGGGGGGGGGTFHDTATKRPSGTMARTDEKLLADLVICDGAPDVTGLHDMDTFLQHQLFRASLALVRRTLRPGGTFVAKMFMGGDADLVEAQARQLFRYVSFHKPLASRPASMETFLVCQDFFGEEGVHGGVLEDFMDRGDLSAYNS